MSSRIFLFFFEILQNIIQTDVSSHVGGYASYCGKCKKFSNITEGSFFETTRIEFEAFFVILWFWASDASVKVVCNCTNYTKVQVVQYYRYFRSVKNITKLAEFQTHLTNRKSNDASRLTGMFVLGNCFQYLPNKLVVQDISYKLTKAP